MNVVIRVRRGGKTAEAIRIAARDFAYIVCISQKECRRIAGIAEDMGLDIPFPITWDEFAGHQYYGKGIKGFVIDNLDLCVQQAAGIVGVLAVTLTGAEPGETAAAGGLVAGREKRMP